MREVLHVPGPNAGRKDGAMTDDRVLIVDDEPNVTRALRRALRKESYEIVCASSAEEALEMLAQSTFHVIVSDHEMPGMRGIEFLAVVRKKYPDTVRIMLTGHGGLDTAMRAINEGDIYRFLSKPWEGPELAVTIRQALQHQRLMRQSQRLLEMTREQNALIQRQMGSQKATEPEPMTRNLGEEIDPERIIDAISREIQKCEELRSEIAHELRGTGRSDDPHDD